MSLAFDGERFTPECVREMWYEHFARYAMARHFVAGKRVLDCACGEGFGSALLAEQARAVLGIDIAPDAIAHARAKYQRGNLSFACHDARALSQAAEPFDLAISFETLEHVAEHDALLASLKSQLSRSGVLMISTPDRHTYSDLTGYQNPFHVRELYRPEFQALLSKHFRFHLLLEQRIQFASAIFDAAAPSRVLFDTADSGAIKAKPPGGALYLIAIASDDEHALNSFKGTAHLFSEEIDSIHAHYQAEIRNGLYAVEVISALKAEIAELKQELAAAESRNPPSLRTQ
jgi:SAM-dependent methyltransferase